MSADLLEAFGESAKVEPAPAGGNRQISRTTANPVADSILDFSATTESSQWHNHGPSNISRIEPIFQPGNDGGNDVLFDASAEPEGIDDDFGDFEAVDEAATSSPNPERSVNGTKPIHQPKHISTQSPKGNNEAALIDLLSLDEIPAQTPSQPQPQLQLGNEPLPSSIEVFESTGHAPQSTQTHVAAPPTISQRQDEDDGWGDFEAVQPSQPAPSTHSPPRYKANAPAPLQATTGMSSRSILRALQPKTPPVPKAEQVDKWDPFEDGDFIAPVSQPTTVIQQAPSSTPASSSAIPIDAQRPTNIPPPALLLSLLPQSFNSLTLILSDRNESITPDLATQITTTFRAAARIISTPARALRWRRDTLLSQSTRIGAAGKSGGMKLSSVNKGETVKEEREAAEAVEAWNSRMHHFSMVLKASGTAMSLRLSMNLPVKPLTGPGIIQATIVCPVCGLKRSERLVGIDDVGVEDVFGEYWLENWGHKECAEWWYRWKEELAQR